MQHGEYAHAIRREGLALASAARTAGVEADVPSCPEWKVADLLGHLGRIHRWVTRMLIERASDRGKHWSETEPPPVDERLDWFQAGVDPLADALVAAGPTVELWTWTPDKTSGFWARRQAHECILGAARLPGWRSGERFTRQEMPPGQRRPWPTPAARR